MNPKDTQRSDAPKVSIVIPAYEQVDLCRRLLSSIEAQSYTDYEVVVTDDSPSDAIETLCTTFSSLPLQYSKNQVPLGSPENWNEGLRRAQGELIKIMHHDDWFTHSDSLQKIVQALEDNPVDVVFCASNYSAQGKDAVHSIKAIHQDKMRDNPHALFLGNYIGAPSVVLYRKNELLFDPQLKWLVDIDFYIRLLKRASGFVVLDEAFISIGIHDDQVTNQCAENQAVEIAEYSHLITKFNLKHSKMHRKHFMNVLKKYDIQLCQLPRNLGILYRLFVFFQIKLSRYNAR